MLGYSQALANDEYCELWRKVLGVKCVSKYLTFDDLVAGGMPDWLPLETVDAGVYLAKFGQTGGGTAVKQPEELGVDVGTLTNVEDAIREDDWSSVM